MHNAIQYAVDRIRHTIPRDLIEDAFGQAALTRHWGDKRFNASVPVSIEARIISEVIDGRVRQDSDLTGAKMIDVPMREVDMRQYDNWTWVIRISDDSLGGCRATQFLGIYIVETSYLSGVSFPWSGQNQLTQGAHGIAAAAGSIPSISSENGHIIGHNTLEINDMNVVRNAGMIRLKVDSDPSMSHLNPSAYPRWADICVLACKAYIYNELVIRTGRGKLESGYDLGVYKDILDEYRDAEESYQDLLRSVWRRVSQLNDPKRRRKAHRYLVSRR